MKMPEPLELLLYDALDDNDPNAIRKLMTENPGIGKMEIPGGYNILTSTFELNPEIALILINEFPESIDYVASEGQHEGQSAFEIALNSGVYEIAEKMIDNAPECIRKQFRTDIQNQTNIIETAENAYASEVIEKLYIELASEIINLVDNENSIEHYQWIDRYFTTKSSKLPTTTLTMLNYLKGLVDFLIKQPESANNSKFLRYICSRNKTMNEYVFDMARTSADLHFIERCMAMTCSESTQEQIDNNYSHILINAIKTNHIDLVRDIAERHPHLINKTISLYHCSPLSYAIVNNPSTEIIDILLPKALTFDEKCILEGKYAGLTPLTLAAQCPNTESFKIIASHMPNINDVDAYNRTAISYATLFNQEIYNFLISSNAQLSIDQGTILQRLSSWLSKSSRDELEAKGYAVDYIDKLIKELKSGHCSGFSWIHRSYMHSNEYFYFMTLMLNIAKWDPNVAPTLTEENAFSELLQILIYAQQDKSLHLARIDDQENLENDPEANEEIFSSQTSPTIARNIQPSSKQSILASPTLIHSEKLKRYNKDSLKEMIDKYSSQNAMIDIGGKFNTKNFFSADYHDVDVGKIERDGKSYYWLYDPNGSLGRVDYDSFDEFYNALSSAFNYYPSQPTLFLSLHTYTPIIEYKHDYSDILNNENNTVFDVLEFQKANYDYFEVEIDEGRFVYIKSEHDKYIINPFDNNSTQSQSISFNNLSDLTNYFNQHYVTIENICGINIRAPKLPSKTAKSVMINLFENNDIEGLTKLLQANPKLGPWILKNNEFENKIHTADYSDVLRMIVDKNAKRPKPIANSHLRNSTNQKTSSPVIKRTAPSDNLPTKKPKSGLF